MFNLKSRIITLAAISTVALTGMAQTGTASAPARTKVTIQGQNGDFSGTVKSSKLHRCADQREITVYKQKGSHQHPSHDQRIGSDLSELHGNKGVWSTGNSGYKSGKFYARAAAKPGCKAGSSRTITE